MEGTFGIRYSSLEQNFSAKLTNGTSIATAHSDQLFRGWGPTASFLLGYPLGSDSHLVLYSLTRGSLLIGDNTKQSDYTLSLPANPAAGFSAVASETRTTVVPVGDFELGVVWNSLTTSQIVATENVPRPILWIKAGFAAQIWGDVGMLAAASNHQFREGNLYLVGLTLQVGVQR
jgi:hypothetical protein